MEDGSLLAPCTESEAHVQLFCRLPSLSNPPDSQVSNLVIDEVVFSFYQRVTSGEGKGLMAVQVVS